MVASNLATNLATNLASPLAGGSGAPTTFQQILGANLRFLVDMRDLANTAAGCVDQINGVAMAGSNSPTFSTSATYNNQRVCAFLRASSQAFDVGAALGFDIVPTASRPYMFVVGRATSNIAADQRWVACFDAAIAVDNQLSLGTNSGSGNTWGGITPGTGFGSYAAPQAAPHLHEVYVATATGVGTWDIDGVNNATSGAGLSTTAALRRVMFGGLPSLATGFWEGSMAICGICTAVPSALQRAQIRTLCTTIWATP